MCKGATSRRKSAICLSAILWRRCLPILQKLSKKPYISISFTAARTKKPRLPDCIHIGKRENFILTSQIRMSTNRQRYFFLSTGSNDSPVCGCCTGCCVPKQKPTQRKSCFRISVTPRVLPLAASVPLWWRTLTTEN